MKDDDLGSEVRLRIIDLTATSEKQVDIASQLLQETLSFPSTNDYVLGNNLFVTALTYVNDTVAYAKSLDHHQFRVLQRTQEYNTDGNLAGYKWSEIAKGPLIDRKVDRMYMCIGLEFLEMGGIKPNIVSVAIRGKSSAIANLSIDFQSSNQMSESYTLRNRVYNQ